MIADAVLGMFVLLALAESNDGLLWAVGAIAGVVMICAAVLLALVGGDRVII